MSKGWSHDSASTMSGNWNEVLVAGLTETAKNGKAAGDSLMKAEVKSASGEHGLSP